MDFEETSLNLGVASELIVRMPLKQGLVNTRGTMTYATRARLLLKTLNTLRKTLVEEKTVRAFAGPVESLRTIDNVRWSILENETQLMMAVSFRGAWEPYIRTIARDAGPVLDSILCNCEGYEAFSSDLGYRKFSSWVRKYQIRTEFFYSAMPDLTVDDLQYLKDLEHDQRSNGDDPQFDLNATKRRVRDPIAIASASAEAPGNLIPAAKQGLKTLCALYRLTRYFPVAGQDNGALFLHRLAHIVLGKTFETLLTKVKMALPPVVKHYQQQISWYESNEKKFRSRTVPVKSKKQKRTLNSKDRKDIQSNVLSSITGRNNGETTHGCMLLLQLDDRKQAKKFLEQLHDTITTEAAPREVAITAAFTYQGLQKLGVPNDKLTQLPKEFREGMAARAGVLGDLRWNHPNNWNLPRTEQYFNQSKLPPQPVPLTTVDLVIQLQAVVAQGTDKDYEWNKQHPLYDIATQLLPEHGVRLLAVEPLRRFIKEDEQGREKVRGHFGFLDGISQPQLKGSQGARDYPKDQVNIGELLLGFEDDHNDPATPLAQRDKLLDKGSFLVLRKLKQNVDELDQFLEESTAETAEGSEEKNQAKELIKAKMMGRFTNGKPLVPFDDELTDDNYGAVNKFDYENDKAGEQCPLHAHIRRCNPRTPKPDPLLPNPEPRPPEPRIFRRGMSYGPDTANVANKDDRGLMFMAYNASIADQFEILQLWVSGGNSARSMSAENDALLGVPKLGVSRPLRFVQDDKVKRYEMNKIDSNDPSTGSRMFVKLEWGMYLFVPTKTGLKELAKYPAKEKQVTLVPSLLERARQAIWQLQALELIQGADLKNPAGPTRPNEQVAFRWKKLLEDLSPKKSGLTAAIWQVIREDFDGVLRTPYGVLLASDEIVMQAFEDPKTYSVRKYWQRMDQSIGQGFLGMDPQPQRYPPKAKVSTEAKALDKAYNKSVKEGRYQRESQSANAMAAQISETDGFLLARSTTKKILQALRDNTPYPALILIQVTQVCEEVLGILSKQWMGIPDGKHIQTRVKPAGKQKSAPRCPSDFLTVGNFIFTPNPSDHILEQGPQLGKALFKAARKYVAPLSSKKVQARRNKNIAERLAGEISDKDLLARTLLGLVQGFVTPTFGSLVSVLNELIESGELWRQQQSWQFASHGANDEQQALIAQEVLTASVVQIMRRAPLPGLLHRTAMKRKILGGSKHKETLKPGDHVVLCVAAAAQEKPSASAAAVLFGGDYCPAGTHQATHPCPGQDMALGVMTGMLSAIFDAGILHKEAPLLLSLKRVKSV